MKEILSPVETADGLFHDGDPSTGAEGTVVHAKWLNAMQGAMIDTQMEHKNILAEVGMKPDGSQSTQLLTAIKAIAAASLSHAVSSVYPVGVVIWFAENKDPNTLFPGTKWTYIGENRTIRLAKKDGSDVMTTGGSDSVKLTVDYFPAHSHTFSANTSSFDYGTKTTSTFDYGTKNTTTNGAHSHVYTRPKINQENYLGTVRVDDGGRGAENVGTSTEGNHSHAVTIGAHSHRVGIGAHTHSVSGSTKNTGSGSAFSVANPFIKLMGWYRSA
ncbi:MAG: phage baseplate protein [Sodalis sp. (in: enterobacteria)]|uniref:phage baseplate protein n=1 Tax=Sodalis sp. (in: enterobacteria) TaxID=1898979 RepID=UPI0039E69AC0